MKTTLFAAYGIRIQHPYDWKVFFDPKRPFSSQSGLIRIEDYVPKKGAQISLSINWEKTEAEEKEFAEKYCENVVNQYKKSFKKDDLFSIDERGVFDYGGRSACFISSSIKGSQKLITKSTDKTIKTMQLAFYCKESGRAVVGTIIGEPELINKDLDYYKNVLYSLDSE